MISKGEALARIASALDYPLPTEFRPLHDALGAVLAADIRSDVDMPPFEKSSVDGWAISADGHEPGRRYGILERIMAGTMPTRPLLAGQTSKVMTGAPLPAGANAVVMVEDGEEAGDPVTPRAKIPPGQTVCHRGEDLAAGQIVLAAGTRIDAVVLGVLAMVGADPVSVFAVPSVCVIPTGDELCLPEGPPPAGAQIRETNGVMLRAQVRGVSPILRAFSPGIARDNPESLRNFLDVGLDHDVLILSGGVSMGDLDLVGGALKERGLEVAIEKVAIKPGKPLLFGRVPRPHRPPAFVFGLPGNPVSSFVTFELFVFPFLRRLLGEPFEARPEEPATYAGTKSIARIPREQHLPCAIEVDATGALRANPLEWHGSADLRGLVDADGLMVVPSAGPALEPGMPVSVIRLPGHRPARARATHRGGGH